ncbi:uncharacterized protein LOC141973621 [Athene noctua]|uniref:uncharacterized protein LOC141973621 n=1 Tax=Athene noctua TaxID=126797 RepID=UPI003EBDFC86
MLVLLFVGVGRCLFAAWTFVRGLTASMGEPGEEILSFFGSFNYPWSLQASMIVAQCFLNVCLILVLAMQHFSNNSSARKPAPRSDNDEWQGVWEKMGKGLSWWSLPMLWNFTPEQMQSPDKLTECLERVCYQAGKTQETQSFLGAVGFGRMHIPNYSLIVSPLYHITSKKNDFEWGPEQQQSLEQIRQEIAQAVALGPDREGPEVKNVLYTAARENGPTWRLWQRAPGKTRGRPLGFWSRGHRGSEADYTPTEKEIVAAYEGVRAASDVVGTETQLLLAPRLPVLGWMFKGKASSTHHATEATWSKWVALITQWAQIGNPSHPGILEVIMNWPESKDSGMSPEQGRHVLRRPHHITSCQMRRSDMPCSLMGLVALWENIDDGRLLCGFPHDRSLKLLRDRVNRVSLQR